MLSTAMKSVGEVMAIGRNFKESLQKALRGLETGLDGFNRVLELEGVGARRDHRRAQPADARPAAQIGQAFREGFTRRGNPRDHPLRPVVPAPHRGDHRRRGGDRPRRPAQRCRRRCAGSRRWASPTSASPRWRCARSASPAGWRETQARALGPAPRRAAWRWPARPARTKSAQLRQQARRAARCSSGSTAAPPSSRRSRRTCTRPTRRRASASPRTRPIPATARKIVILGGGPNRIGQGIEFDYCCVHACFALERGRATRRS